MRLSFHQKFSTLVLGLLLVTLFFLSVTEVLAEHDLPPGGNCVALCNDIETRFFGIQSASPDPADTSITLDINGQVYAHRSNSCQLDYGYPVYTGYIDDLAFGTVPTGAVEIVNVTGPGAPGPFTGTIPVTFDPGHSSQCICDDLGGTCSPYPDKGDFTNFEGSRTFSVATLAEGSYTVTLRVTDDASSGGLSDEVTIQFDIEHLGPPPEEECAFDYSLTADKTVVVVGETLTFTSTVSNVSNCDEQWRHRIDGEAPYNGGNDWDYDPGAGTQRTRTFTTSYGAQGTYVARGDLWNALENLGAQDDTPTITVNSSAGALSVDLDIRDTGQGSYHDGPQTLPYGSAGVDLQWTTTDNPDSCEASATPTHSEWDGDNNPAPSGGTWTLDSNVDRAFSVTCSKSGSSNVGDSASVEVVGTVVVSMVDTLGAPVSGGLWNLTGPTPQFGSQSLTFSSERPGAYQLVATTPPPGFRLVSIVPVSAQPLDSVNPSITFTATYQEAYTLTTSKAGAGFGTITSVPAGITCGSQGTDCTEEYDEGTDVTLTATPEQGSTFTGWSVCSTQVTPQITLDMTANRNCTATFTIQSLACSGAPATPVLGEDVTFTGVGGGSGAWSWTTDGEGTPPTGGNSSQFVTEFLDARPTTKTVTVTRGISSAECTVTVTVDPSLEVSPPSAEIGIGEEFQFTALYDDDGNGTEFLPRDVTQNALWSVLPASVAQSLGLGRVKGVSAGPAEVKATYSGEEDTATLIVASQCSDREDNDGDEDIDLDDPGCVDEDDDSEGSDQSIPECRDGLDNDGDGKIDFGTGAGNDPGCTSLDDKNEQDLGVEEF